MSYRRRWLSLAEGVLKTLLCLVVPAMIGACSGKTDRIHFDGGRVVLRAQEGLVDREGLDLAMKSARLQADLGLTDISGEEACRGVAAVLQDWDRLQPLSSVQMPALGRYINLRADGYAEGEAFVFRLLKGTESTGMALVVHRHDGKIWLVEHVEEATWGR